MRPDQIEIIEDALFFNDDQYPVNFHSQKLLFHRASMKAFTDLLIKQGWTVHYRDWEIDVLTTTLSRCRAGKIIAMDPVDHALLKRLKSHCASLEIALTLLPSNLFINTPETNRAYRVGKKRWFMADFYQHQRLTLNIMVKDGKPKGGKWSFDHENRKKIPLKERGSIPDLTLPSDNKWTEEARAYVATRFPNAVGEMSQVHYPVTFEAAEIWFEQFLTERFGLFGQYEDALVPGKTWLYHSVLAPLLNTGLLHPDYVVNRALEYAAKDSIPINSLEGFVRQIIGWREFMRATYEDLGVSMRNGNHWNHHRKIPQTFYTGDTGITPVDDVIKRVLRCGYCHHIERLMVLGGFMFLCEFDPKSIYRWFMAMFIDAYDWVMVPNVFAMSQNADGGLITTKPYFSGSAYLKKMGYNDTGEWCDIWDGLYWRWIDKHSNQLSKNPRWAMMCSMAVKMETEKLQRHKDRANTYLRSLDAN